MTNSPDPFFEPYDRQQIAYGDTPAPGVQSIIELTSTGAAEKHEAVDLGAGAGRDSISADRAADRWFLDAAPAAVDLAY